MIYIGINYFNLQGRDSMGRGVGVAKTWGPGLLEGPPF